jgi:hypothetical protein
MLGFERLTTAAVRGLLLAVSTSSAAIALLLLATISTTTAVAFLLLVTASVSSTRAMTVVMSSRWVLIARLIKPLVLMILDALFGQSLNNLGFVIRAKSAEPLLKSLHHLVLDFGVPSCIVGVVEGLEDDINDTVGIRVVAPSFNEEPDRIRDNSFGDLASRLVKNEAKVILGITDQPMCFQRIEVLFTLESIL